MTDTPDPKLVARARRAYAQSIANDPPATICPDPEALARMQRALDRLPRLTRTVFLAHRIDGRSYGEIAKATGLSVVQVERHMACAIGRLHLSIPREGSRKRQPRWRAWFAKARR